MDLSVLQRGDSEPPHLGLHSLEQRYPPRIAALAEWRGSSINYHNIRSLVVSSLGLDSLIKRTEFGKLLCLHLVRGIYRDLLRSACSIARPCPQGPSETASFHCGNASARAHGVVFLRLRSLVDV